MIDHIIVGAGFAGAVVARELAEAGGKVLVVEKRAHIGGNCYDEYDESGVLIHTYGPHLFHTDNELVFDYLSRFCRWQPYQHKVLAEVDGKQVPVPFNLNSIEMLFPALLAAELSEKLVARFGFGSKVPILRLRQSKDEKLQFLADYIYEKIFLGYTVKQWGCKPEDIDPEVMSRVPVLVSRDDRYFQDRFQAVPATGYSKLFAKMLAHPDIHILLNTDYRDVLSFNQNSGAIKLFGHDFTGKMFFTGMVDELFSFKFGELPYRALDFSFETFSNDSYQDAAVVNYPSLYKFTRITEFKKITFQDVAGKTVILREFPCAFERADKNSVPCYPILQAEGQEMYKQYKEHSLAFNNLVLLGRLAEYRYYDMDDIVERALAVCRDFV